ncbi:17238_t:CDS:2, partial [Gigaspora margarita]
KAIMNNTINTIEDMNLLSDESDFNTNLLNNEPEIVPVKNNESEIGLVENDESEIDLVENDESEIELVKNDFEYNDENTDESSGWSSDENISLIGPPELYAKKLFSSWTIVNRSIKVFAYHNSFSVQKYRSEKLNGKCIRCTYLCQHSSVYKPVKNKTPEKQRNKSSACHSLKVSLFENKHENHTLDPINRQFAPQFRRLTQKIFKNIKFYTQEDHLGATNQHLLYNAIQQFCNENDPNLNDAARLLEYLLDQKHNNIDLYV